MPHRVKWFLIGTLVLVCVGVAVAQSNVEHPRASPANALAKHDEPPIAETEFRLNDYQHLKRLLLHDGDRLR
jgi:hypothetical protein